MLNTSWIKLHRKLIDSLVFQNEKCLKVWIWCLCKAGYKEKEVLFGKKKIELKRGQFIMGGFTAEETLHIARTTIYYWLDFLEKEGMVDIKKTNKYTVITIRNWDAYQEVDNKRTSKKHQITQQMDIKWTSKRHKQEYKELEERKEELLIEHPLQKFIRENLPNISKLKIQLTNEDCERLLTDFPKEVIRDVLEAMENNKELNKKYLSVNLTIRNWAKRRLVNGADKQGTPKRRGEFDAEKFAELLNSKPEV